MTQVDPHSYFDSAQPRVRHLTLRWNLDFEARTVAGEVELSFDPEASRAGPIDLDTKGLSIEEVRDPAGRPVDFELAQEEPILGRRLRLLPRDPVNTLTIRYRTSEDAVALQWLTASQTEGQRNPFLFSQCQPIHARTMIPLQDTPKVRTTYRAEVTVPTPLTVVMSAGSAGMKEGDGTRTYAFEMPQPIPSYLIAIAAGELANRDLGPRSRVYAEPEMLERAAYEFAEIESMIAKAEALFGPYEWDRYDMLVLPPSFPYGGMENPRMTFLTPTIISGDRSLVSVVAHELAHSWTGNLVTNATWEHFWLNEGFTVWAERRIVEAVYGQDEVDLGWALGQKSLEGALGRFGAGSPFTRLRTDLHGVDPDEAYSTVPYEKGARFLALLEREVTRPGFDRFVRRYMDRYRFTSLTTEEFLAFVDRELPGAAERVNAQAWLFAPDLPANAPVFKSRSLEDLIALAKGFPEGARPSHETMAAWKPGELLVYLQNLLRVLDWESCEWLDSQLDLTSRGNHEILVEWLTIAGGSDYEPVFARLREVQARVGRMKYLRPLYTALGRSERTRSLAREIFAEAGASYHPISRKLAESILAAYPNP